MIHRALKTFLHHPIFPLLASALVCLTHLPLPAQDSVDDKAGAGWRNSDWLGEHYVADEVPGWLWHRGMGWLYAYADPAEGSAWFYRVGSGHLWSGAEVYPWLYFLEEENWVYYVPETFDPAYYYHLVDNTWRVGPTEFLSVKRRSRMAFTPFGQAPIFPRIGLVYEISPFLQYRELELPMHGGIQVRDLPLQRVANIRQGQPIQIRGAWDASFSADFPRFPAFLNFGFEGSVYNVGLESDGDAVTVNWWDGNFAGLDPLPPATVYPVGDFPKAVVDFYGGSILNPGRYTVRVGLISETTVLTPFETLTLWVNRMAPPPLEGNIIADSGFRPNPNGFGFPNFTDIQDGDITAEDLHFLLGPAASWETSTGERVLKATSRLIINPLMQDMTGGHCFGMALAAMALYEGRSLAGEPLDLARIDPTAEAVIDLQQFQARHFVSVAMAMQSTSHEFYNNVQASGSEGPTAVLDFLIEEFQAGRSVPIIGMTYRDRPGGHAVTPYAITDEGDGIFRIHCWDNNFPDNMSFVVEVDTNRDTWFYTSTNPTIGAAYGGEFSGDAETQNLAYVGWSMIDDYQPGITPDSIVISSSANAQMLVENADGGRVGYDFETDTFVEEYPGARVLPIAEVNKAPKYLIPIPEGGGQLDLDADVDAIFDDIITVEVGLPPEAEVDALPVHISFQSESFVKTVSGVTARKGETFEVLTHASGRLFAADGEDVDISRIVFEFAVNDDSRKRGYLFKLTNFAIEPDSGIMVIIGDDYNPLVWNIIGEDLVELSPEQYTFSKKVVGVGIGD